MTDIKIAIEFEQKNFSKTTGELLIDRVVTKELNPVIEK